MQRRRITDWLRARGAWALDNVCESTVRVVAGDGLRNNSTAPPERKWGRVSGERSRSRWVLVGARADASGEDAEAEVATVDATESSGIELDLCTMQLTLKAAHLKALPRKVADQPDVLLIELVT